MTDSNGKQKPSDIAHRVGIWTAVTGIALYVFNMGAWVGAADEKFEDAATVEHTQQALLLQVNTVATKQEAIEEAVAENKQAIKDSEKAVLAAIAELKE